ncbi:uncharacterized protein LOC128546617 [Mercenaria mercenaria]|uniref:uncharacterized protein LOC128546617 n=1 Tax=Mercenaria mercenaria TaxID=6596 RepID=UPI00234FA188|nr:uncharacterized protein LOC128546617 [Mercenaria mercenaria]
MDNSNLKATGSLVHKFKILNIKGPGNYRCNTKKLQKYLSGNPETTSPSVQPAALEDRLDELKGRTFTRQSCHRTINFFSAVPKLSKNEFFNRHSLCGSQKLNKGKALSPANILEYSYNGAKRICGECGLRVFELDFAFICSNCGQLIHKGCTDVCKRRHECVICGGETNANRIYPFCQINNLSELINGDEQRKRTFKGPTKTHAEKCFPIIRSLNVTAKTYVNPIYEKCLDNGKRRRQSKHLSDYMLPQPSKRRKIEYYQRTTYKNTHSRQTRSLNETISDAPHDSVHTACKTLKDVRNKRLKSKTNRSETGRGKLNTNVNTDQIANEGISLFVSKTLDFLGYSFEMIKYRQRMYHANDEIIARFNHQPDTRVTTGGKGEGTTMYFENDTDYMYVVKQIICTDYPQVFVNIKNITVFQTKRNIASPGYTRLELLRFSGRYLRDEIRTSLFETQSGSLYLSNEEFIDSLQILQDKTCTLGGFTKGERTGPSTPISDKYNSFDDVIGLPCCCPNVLEKWFARPRHNIWPPQEVMHALSLLDAHVVPVGFKGSPDQNVEWRICFSLAELHLMQILNECQIQTYILLKKIAKTCLQPISKDITSYVVKNTILWICEKTPTSFFQKKHILL